MQRGGDFYTALCASQRLELCLGTAEFVVKGRVGQRRLADVPFGRLYKFAFYTVTLCYTSWFVVQNDILEPLQVEGAFAWFLIFVDLHVDVVYQGALVVSVLLRGRRVREAWYGIMAVDGEMTVDNRPVGLYSRAWLVVAIVVNTCNQFTAQEVLTHQRLHLFEVSNTLFWIMCFYMIGTVSAFQAWMLSLKVRLEALHAGLTEDNLPKTRRLLQELCQVRQVIGEVYSLPVLMVLLRNFIVVILQLYEFSVLFGKRSVHWKHVLTTVCWLTLAAVKTLSIVISATLVTNRETLLKRRVLELSLLTASSKQVTSFGLQMLHWDMRTTIGGILEVDLSLVFKIVGATTTYLVMLSQFNYLTSRHSSAPN
ncbi:uncharacterized protein LOC116162368 [Photinus pyralis]|nr:uncharacterized protein LOC116162368 [Photinus pyralis]